MIPLARPPFAAARRPIIDTADFWLPLEDKGNGEVSLLLGRGSGSATFTRATIATTIDRNGLVKQVAAGVPRSYYDPTTLAYRGYLAEGARTNLLVRSEELDNASWTKTRSSVTANATAAPDGATTADKVVEDSTAANNHVIATPNWTSVSGTPTTLSVFLKAGERSRARIGISTNHITGTGANGLFTLTGDGTAAVVNDCTAAIVKYPNGWYRCSITFTPTASSGGSSFIYLDNGASTTYDGDGTSGLYAWGAQLEAAAFASSYIPTTTASVQRNADFLQFDSGDNADASVGTLYCEAAFFDTATGINRYTFMLDDGTTNNSLGILLGSGLPGVLQVRRAAATEGSVSMPGGAMSPNVANKLAVAYAAAGSSAVKNGGTIGTIGAITLPTFSKISVGHDGNAGQQPFGTVRNARIWKRQIANAGLQALTA